MLDVHMLREAENPSETWAQGFPMVTVIESKKPPRLAPVRRGGTLVYVETEGGNEPEDALFPPGSGSDVEKLHIDQEPVPTFQDEPSTPEALPPRVLSKMPPNQHSRLSLQKNCAERVPLEIIQALKAC